MIGLISLGQKKVKGEEESSNDSFESIIERRLKSMFCNNGIHKSLLNYIFCVFLHLYIVY